MLRELSRQVSAFDTACEVLVLFNPEQIDGSEVEALIRQHLVISGKRTGTPVRVIPAPGLHYYDLRNFGVTQAVGDIVVCLDSDVIPEPVWLDAITSPLRNDPEIVIVGGETHLDATGSLFDKAFALGWIFPMRSDDDSLRSDDRQFWANNVAFRRSFLLANTYPVDHTNHECRNACRRMREQLLERGTPIWRAGRARVSHPAPDGWKAALLHGLVEGRDNALIWEERGKGRVSRGLRAADFVFGRLKQTARNFRSRSGSLGINAWHFLPALVIMGAYHLITLAGSWSQVCLPERVWKDWQI